MDRMVRQFVLVLSLLVLTTVLVPAHAPQPGGAPPLPKTEVQADAAAKKREKETAKRRADEEKKQAKTAKRRDQEDKKRAETARRRDAEDQKRRETARRRTENDDDRNRRAARRDNDGRRPSAEASRRSEPPKPARVVFVGGYFYDPFLGPYPWWPPAVYPYRWAPRFDGRSHVRVLASPKNAAVYVDGFYAGIVDDFDGLFQPLPLLPGGHTITLYLDGYRTVNKSVYLTPGSTMRLREDMERLPPGIASAPPAVAPALPPPPPGTYIDVRTSPREQPQPPAPEPDAQAPGFGVLSLRIQPPNAVVTIDGQEWLTTKPGELVIHRSAGRHLVTVSMPERPLFSTEVDVRDGETTELNLSVPPRTTQRDGRFDDQGLEWAK